MADLPPPPHYQGQDIISNNELSAVVLTYNEAAHVVDCINSLKWADRVIVFDRYSEDDTAVLAETAGAELYQNPFQNFAQQRNDALDKIKTGWVFFVDADERGTPDLASEIRRLIEIRAESGYYVPRHNYIFNRLTLGAGWFPDYQLRLFRHGHVRYERPVHEIAIVDGEIGYLQNPLIHYNYRDRAQFHAKQRAYTDYDAGILKEQGIKPKPHRYLTQPARHLWWRFITLRGYKDGWHGLRLSLYMAYYEWVKYRKLAQIYRDTSA